MNIYIAGPLFTEAERAWLSGLRDSILALSDEIGAGVEIALPQDFMTQAEIEQLADQAGMEIFGRCISHLDRADLVLAVLDGSMVDDGTAWEVGYYYGRRNPASRSIIGIRTDFRVAGERKSSIINAMIEHSCDRIFRTTGDLISYLRQALTREPKFPG